MTSIKASTSQPHLFSSITMGEMKCFLLMGTTLCLVVFTQTQPASETEISTSDDLQYIFFPAKGKQIRFQVKAPHDAHIALTSGPVESDPMWEILIGGWYNTATALRKNRVKPYEVKRFTPKILTKDDFRGFWIRWNGGNLTVGLEDEEEPFLTLSDAKLDEVTHFGIRTSWGAKGEWHITEPDIEITPRRSTTSQDTLPTHSLRVKKEIKDPEEGLVSWEDEADSLAKLGRISVKPVMW